VADSTGAFSEQLGVLDLVLDDDVVPRRDSACQRGDGRREPEAAQHVRLQVLAEGAELPHRLAGEVERPREDLGRLGGVAFPESPESGIEHLGDRREVLHRPVVEELGEPPALLLLGEDPLPQEGALGLVGGQSIIASRSAIATACVRVSASSFARMWRTWLFTVS